jgi:hypothetical protein
MGRAGGYRPEIPQLAVDAEAILARTPQKVAFTPDAPFFGAAVPSVDCVSVLAIDASGDIFLWSGWHSNLRPRGVVDL